MRVLGASTLGLLAIVVLLAIPAAVMAGWNWISVPTPVLIVGGIVIALALITVAGMLPRRGAITAGWVLQGVVILTGFFAPLMFFIGAIFAVLWYYSVRIGTRIDSQREQGGGPDRVAS